MATRKTRTMAVLLLAVLVVGTIGLGTANAWVGHVLVQVTNDYGIQKEADVDGSIIVWQDKQNFDCGGPGWNVHMYDMGTGEKTVVADGYGQQQEPRVSGDTIVYMSNENDDCMDVFMYDIPTGQTEMVAGGTDGQNYPDVSGDYVVWRDAVEDTSINMHQISTGVDSVVATGSALTRVTYPRIDDGLIVWREKPSCDGEAGDEYAVKSYSIATGQTSTVATSAYYLNDVTVGDGYIAWVSDVDDEGRDEEINLYKIATGSASVVCTWAVWPDDLELDGGRLAFTHYLDFEDREPPKELVPAESSRNEIAVYDIASGECLDLPTSDECQSRPNISGNLVVWNRYIPEDGYPDIFAYTLEDIPTVYVPEAGPTRYDTAVTVSQASYADDSAETVIIATGANWPDALGASALAGMYDAPILLTAPGSIPACVVAEIDRLGAVDAFVIGGENAISAEVFTELEGLLSGTVTRLGGATRFETAEIVAAEAIAANDDWDGTAFITTGGTFPDALAAAPLAAKAGWPIYLTGADGIDAATQAVMDAQGVGRVLILGGYGVVPLSVEIEGVETAEVERISGMTRYGTAVAIATWGVENLGLSWNGVAVATGENYPDALSAGAAQGLKGSVMLLTPSDYLDPVSAAAFATHRQKIGAVCYVGGEAAVSKTVRDEIAAILP